MIEAIETKVVDVTDNVDSSDLNKFQLNYPIKFDIPPAKLNKKEINIIFNQGMDDFLKNNKSAHDCPYNEDDIQRVEAWREGFKYAVEVYTEKFAEYCVREMIIKNRQSADAIPNSADIRDTVFNDEVVEIVEK